MPIITGRENVLAVYEKAAKKGWVIPCLCSENLTTTEAILTAASEFATEKGYDRVPITLAITNLIENAIKYNKNNGEGWVHVSLNADHKYFYIKVEDNGMGMPEESLEHIYERFYRVDKSHSREIGGTGLGLAITRNAISMHKGAIKVHSELNEGTTFDVRIPLNYIV